MPCKPRFRAKEVGKGVPEVWTNLISILVAKHAKPGTAGLAGNAGISGIDQARQDPKIQEVLQEAEIELPEQIKPFVLGRCYAILKNYGQAQSHFAVALRSDPKNASIKQMYAETLMAENKAPEAARLIEQILKEANPVKNVNEIAWARRSMARILSSTLSYAAFNKGLELIEQNAVNGELGRQDLALLLTLCFTRPERSSWDLALNRLDKVENGENKRPLNDDELFMKAQLYEKYGDEGKWQAAKEMTVGVLSRNHGNLKVVESYIRWLLKRGELQEAKRYATNNLDQSAVTRLRVELHSDAKAGRIKEAVAKIKQRTPPDPNSNEELSSLVLLASISEELGQYNEGFYQLAESLLQKVVNKLPREILRLATTMGIHGDTPKIKKALQYCMDAESVKVANTVSAGVALAILRAHPEKWEGDLASALTAIGQWLDKLASASPKDLGLRWRVAEFHDMVGNLDRVETEYQNILDTESFNNPLERGMLLNNLAYAMALNGKSDKPQQFIEESEKLLGPTSDVIDTRGFVHLVRGELVKSASDFRKAISSGPETAQKLFHLAMVLDKQNDATGAEAAWKRALNIGLTKFRLPQSLRDEFDGLQFKYGGTPVAQLN